MSGLKVDYKILIGGVLAGIIAGIFGGGGGLVLVPLLSMSRSIPEESLFPASISIILPICIVSLLSIYSQIPLAISDATLYLVGSFIGGLIAIKIGNKIPTLYLHRVLGGMIIWGGLRYICT